MKEIKVLLAKLGLDIHNRGVLTVAKSMRDAGMEVIYIANSTPEDIISSSVQEGVDVVGVSSLGGAHVSLGRKLMELAGNEGIKDDRVFVMGGAVPEDDIKILKASGFDAIFTSGARTEDMMMEIKKLVADKRKNNG
jgi:methylmalonyl-CoA mutase C-terminal domain/subunit